MRLQQVLDELLEILQAESEGKHFKSLGALRKSKFQNSKSTRIKNSLSSY